MKRRIAKENPSTAMLVGIGVVAATIGAVIVYFATKPAAKSTAPQLPSGLTTTQSAFIPSAFIPYVPPASLVYTTPPYIPPQDAPRHYVPSAPSGTDLSRFHARPVDPYVTFTNTSGLQQTEKLSYICDAARNARRGRDFWANICRANGGTV